MANTNIEWTESVWNPVTGCDKVSAGCKNCYAETMARRLQKMGQPNYANGFAVTLQPHMLDIPLKRMKPTKYFVNSMSDLFHEEVPFSFIEQVFGVMALCPQHIFQVLTKRPERMKEFFDWSDNDFCHENTVGEFFEFIYGENGVRQHLKAAGWGSYSWKDAEGIKDTELLYEGKLPLPNVWLGVSVENQKAADERILLLLKTPAAVRWLSCEPLLSEVDLEWVGKSDHWDYTRWNCLTGEAFAVANPNTDNEIAWDSIQPNGSNPIDWVVVGGESGHNARPCDLNWIRSIVEQCKSASVPVFVKQLGANVISWGEPLLFNNKKGGDILEFPKDLRIREFPE